MSLFFSKKSRRDPARRAELSRFRRVMMDNDKDAIIRFAGGIFGREGVVEHLAEITVPTLVIVGEEDKVEPLARAQRIAEGIPGSKLLIVPNAGHISSFDGADMVTAALEKHLALHE